VNTSSRIHTIYIYGNIMKKIIVRTSHVCEISYLDNILSSYYLQYTRTKYQILFISRIQLVTTKCVSRHHHVRGVSVAPIVHSSIVPVFVSGTAQSPIHTDISGTTSPQGLPFSPIQRNSLHKPELQYNPSVSVCLSF